MQDVPSFPNGSGVGLSGTLSRIVVQLVGLTLMGVGVYLVFLVFMRVGDTLRDPAGLAALTDGIAARIDADKLVLPVPNAEQPAPIGKTVAMAFTFLFYVLWAWLALAVLGAGGRLISWTLADAKHTRELLADLLRRQAGAGSRDRLRV